MAEVDGVRRMFDTVITERRPDRRICWVSVHGPEQVGVVTFDEGTRPGRSRVTLQLEYSPRAVPDRVVDKRSFLQETVSGCLRRFAEVVEGRKRSGAGPQESQDGGGAVAVTDPDALARWMGDVDFPASKEQLVAHAERSGADPEVLRALPLADYRNLDEVMQSVPVAVERTEADRARQRREHTKPGLAEHMKDIPRSPIVEELGENRGS